MQGGQMVVGNRKGSRGVYELGRNPHHYCDRKDFQERRASEDFLIFRGHFRIAKGCKCSLGTETPLFYM
jgi:hypothetical protein